MWLHKLGGRFLLHTPTIGASMILFLLLWHGDASDINLFSGTLGASDTNGSFNIEGSDTPGVGIYQRSVIMEYEDSSTASKMPKLNSLGTCGKLAGWFLSSWAGKCLSGHMTEQTVKQAARSAGDSPAHVRGMRYFAIEDCWLGQQQRAPGEVDGNKKVKVDEAIFPHGVTSLAQSVQDNGLAFGMGVTISSEQCAQIEPAPANIGEIDVIHAISEWGVDFLKLNSCASSTAQAVKEFRRWRDAARAASPQPLLICMWTNETHTTKADLKASELRQLCDDWISPEHSASGWSELQENVDVWLRSQQESDTASQNVPRFALHESVDPSNEAMQTQLALAAVLGSQLAMTSSSTLGLNQQANLLKDDVMLAAASDPMNQKVQRRSGPGDLDVLARQLADGDYIVALINWGSEDVPVAASHERILEWCGLHKPVPLKVTQAWTKKSMEMASEETHSLDDVIGEHGAILLQVELMDNLRESQEAMIYSDHPTEFLSASSESGASTVDVFHRTGYAPAFTAGSRIVDRWPYSTVESVSFRGGAKESGLVSSDGAQADKSLDTFFKTIFGLLLPMMVASAIDDSTPTKDKSNKSHHHHKRHHHHHHHHHHHEHHKNEENKHEDRSQTHVEASIRRPANESFSPVVAVKAPSSSSSESKPDHASNSNGCAGWVLLGGLAVLGCLAIVAAWRALLVRTLRKKSWELEDAQLMERPHAH